QVRPGKRVPMTRAPRDDRKKCAGPPNRGAMRKTTAFPPPSPRNSRCRSMRLHCRSTTRRGHRLGLARRLGETDVDLVRILPRLTRELRVSRLPVYPHLATRHVPDLLELRA